MAAFILNEKPGAYFSKANREKLQEYINAIPEEAGVTNVANLMMYLYDRATGVKEATPQTDNTTQVGVILQPDEVVVKAEYLDQLKLENSALDVIISSPEYNSLFIAVRAETQLELSHVEILSLIVTAQASELETATNG